MTDLQKIDLLIVDDDDGFRQTLVHRFLRHGFQVQDAADAEQAMSLAQRRDFDVAVFDIIMPGISGLELLERFKKATPTVRSSCSPVRARSRRPWRR